MPYPTTEAEAYEVLGWSADVEDEAELDATLSTTPKLRIVKIDRLFQAKNGSGCIKRLQERGKLVFDDSKLVEIPSKLEALAKVQVANKPWMLNCMAGSLSNEDWSNPDRKKLDGLKLFADVCLQAGTKPCAVTVLTSKEEATVAREFNKRGSTDQVLFYVEVLIRAGFTDMVCSPLEAAAVAAKFGADAPDRNCPGIVMPNGDSPDQARTNTPSGALLGGADRLICGRALTGPQAAENARKIVEHILANRPQAA